MEERTYFAFYVPTGVVFKKRTVGEMSTLTFLLMLNDWNRKGQGTWQYWGEV